MTDTEAYSVLAHRITVLEAARDHISLQLDDLRSRQHSLEARLVAAETMQPVVAAALTDVKTEISKINTKLGQIAIGIIVSIIGAFIAWMANGGMVN